MDEDLEIARELIQERDALRAERDRLAGEVEKLTKERNLPWPEQKMFERHGQLVDRIFDKTITTEEKAELEALRARLDELEWYEHVRFYEGQVMTLRADLAKERANHGKAKAIVEGDIKQIVEASTDALQMRDENDQLRADLAKTRERIDVLEKAIHEAIEDMDGSGDRFAIDILAATLTAPRLGGEEAEADNDIAQGRVTRHRSDQEFLASLKRQPHPTDSSRCYHGTSLDHPCSNCAAGEEE